MREIKLFSRWLVFIFFPAKDILFVNCKPIPISEKQYNSENETLTFIGFQFENIREIKYLDVGDGDHDHDDRML